MTTASNLTAVDQRRHVRLRLTCDVAYAGEAIEKTAKGQMRDISGGGLRLATPEDRPSGGTILLRFALPGLRREIVARGRIIMSFFNAEDRDFHHGIAFTSIDPADQLQIINYVAAARSSNALGAA